MKVFVFLFPVLFSINAYSQTCIIAVKTKDKIVVAADSKMGRVETIFKNGRYIDDTLLTLSCKIYHFGNTYFSLAGKFPQGLPDIIGRICSQYSSVGESFSKIPNVLNPILYRWVDSLRLANRNFYNSIMTVGDFLKILFYGFENGLPYLAEHDFTVVPKFNGFDFGVRPYQNSPVKDSLQFLVIGESSAFPQVNDFYKIIEKGKVDVVMRSVIKKQAAKTPETVSEPIDIIEIKRKGERWIERKQMCK